MIEKSKKKILTFPFNTTKNYRTNYNFLGVNEKYKNTYKYIIPMSDKNRLFEYQSLAMITLDQVREIAEKENLFNRAKNDTGSAKAWKTYLPQIALSRHNLRLRPYMLHFELNGTLEEQCDILESVLETPLANHIVDIVYSGEKSYVVHIMIRKYNKETKEVINCEITDDEWLNIWGKINWTFFSGKAKESGRELYALSRHAGGFNSKTGQKQNCVYYNPYVKIFDVELV